MSFELFRKKSVKEEEFDSVMIKKEQMSDFDEKEINSEQFDFHDTEIVDENDLPDIIQVLFFLLFVKKNRTSFINF